MARRRMNGSATWFISMALITRGPHALLLQRVLQRQSVDDGGEHAHVVGGDAVHGLGLLGDTAEEVAAANDDGDLDAECMHFADLGRDLVYAHIVHAKALAGSQRLTRKLQQNSFVSRSRHSSAGVPEVESSVAGCDRDRPVVPEAEIVTALPQNSTLAFHSETIDCL